VVDELQRTGLEDCELWLVGISMVFTDVHVNRAPIAGRIVLVKHQPGQFCSLRLPEAVNLNERQTMVFDNGRFQVAIVQIASRLVRRIEAYVGIDEHVTLGQRVGMIKFGSQVDIILPVRWVPALLVTVGQRLIAGESVLARST
jgi:phosphatidylserine decarboxylase